MEVVLVVRVLEVIPLSPLCVFGGGMALSSWELFPKENRKHGMEIVVP